MNLISQLASYSYNDTLHHIITIHDISSSLTYHYIIPNTYCRIWVYQFSKGGQKRPLLVPAYIPWAWGKGTTSSQRTTIKRFRYSQTWFLCGLLRYHQNVLIYLSSRCPHRNTRHSLSVLPLPIICYDPYHML